MIYNKRDRVLDFWRGIGILMVLVHHLVYFRYIDSFRGFLSVAHASASSLMHLFGILDRLLLEFAERSGPYGVKLFFVVSGFIITKHMLAQEEKNNSLSVRAFYVRRIFRILPAYFVFIGSLALFSMLEILQLGSGDILGAATFLCNSALAECSTSVIHTWSLAVEMQFYLVWPLAFVFVAKRYRTTFLFVVLGVLLALSAGQVLVAHGWLDNALAFACIAIGALYAVSDPFAKFVRRFGIPTSLGFIALICLLSLADGTHELARRLYWEAQPFVLLTIIFSVYRCGWLVRSYPFFLIANIGLISYSLYLWQEVFATSTPAQGSLFSYSFLMIPFALASYFFIEKPMIRWGRELTHKDKNA